MIASMTAFGRQEAAGDWGQAVWELRTVNHRYLEVTIRLPEDLRQLETAVRSQIAKRLSRGKVDCTLRYEPDDTAAGEIPVNQQLAAKLIKAATTLPLQDIARINPVDILRWPGVIMKETPDTEKLSQPLLQSLDAALDMIIDTRRREGASIHGMILERCDSARVQVDRLRTQLPAMIEALRERIVSRAGELSVNLDGERLEQEVVLLVNRMDVAEELDRLESHLAEVRHLLDETAPVGRRLDFLMQELNREANTLGSKAMNSEVTNASVELKVLIEQMREQIQNVE